MAWDLNLFCDTEAACPNLLSDGSRTEPNRFFGVLDEDLLLGCIVAYALGITDVDPLDMD
jgi:hypothetical protein